MTMKTELASARRFLREVMPEGARVLCAVSGGVDSMCLLEFLSVWGIGAGISVTAAHFNHSLRPTADRDETFVRDYCVRQGIPFLSGRGDTRQKAAESHLSIEEAARVLRYAFLETAAQQAGCQWICTAHHADDCAETMLLNLIRGTGSAGLAGIPRVRGTICRPFLDLTRQELEAYAAAHEIPHVEDETNRLEDASRNVLRHQVLPVLQELNPRAVENMTRTAAILAREDAAICVEARALLASARSLPEQLSIPCAALEKAPEAVAQRAILLALEACGGHSRDLTAAHTLAVASLLAHPRRVLSLPYGLTARRERDMLLLAKRPPLPQDAPLSPGTPVLFGGWSVQLGPKAPSGGLTYALTLPPHAPLYVSPLRPGERMILPGARGSRTLKRLCVDAGIPLSQRDGLPVLRCGEQPAAAPGIGIASSYTPRSSKETVFVTFLKLTEENRT